MLFNSYEFIFLFLPVALLGYIALGRFSTRRIALTWLIAASLFFYGWWNPAYLGLILGSMFFNYSVGTLLSTNSKNTNKKLVMIAGVTVNLLLLAYFKYANFFVDNINIALDVGWNLENIILPLAISFLHFSRSHTL